MTRRRFIFDIAALVAWITPLGFPRHATGQQPTSLKHIGGPICGFLDRGDDPGFQARTNNRQLGKDGLLLKFGNEMPQDFTFLCR